MNNRKTVLLTTVLVIIFGIFAPIIFTYQLGFWDILNISEYQPCPTYQALIHNKIVSNDTCYAYLNVIKLDRFYLTPYDCSSDVTNVINVYPISCGFSGQNFEEMSISPTFNYQTVGDQIFAFIMICLIILFWCMIVTIIFGTSFGIIQEHKSVNSGSIKRPRNKILVNSN